jgi:3-deoxy-D-manno-octulosonate 8-phosphate phosphatase (KDO 8-P phosphatase)
MTDKPKHFVLDVDGVLSTGQFIYSNEGKLYKVFGAHDSDGLNLIKDTFNIIFISADERGFEISKKRVSDMGFEISLVPASERMSFMESLDFTEVIFMGDGYYDAEIFKYVNYAIAPKNARIEALNNANYITDSEAGEGAVMDACIHIMNKFLE